MIHTIISRIVLLDLSFRLLGSQPIPLIHNALQSLIDPFIR
jgi:hypothetical protein